MPTYEYQCKSCNHRFEIWQKMSDEPLTTCPQCSGTIRRILFPAGIVFKGSGFYKTDHGSGAAPSEAKTASSTENKESAPKTESTSESKAGAETASVAATAGSESKVSTVAKD